YVVHSVGKRPRMPKKLALVAAAACWTAAVWFGAQYYSRRNVPEPTSSHSSSQTEAAKVALKRLEEPSTPTEHLPGTNVQALELLKQAQRISDFIRLNPTPEDLKY